MGASPELNAKNIRILAGELKRQRDVIEEQTKIINTLKTELGNIKQELIETTQKLNILNATTNMNTFRGSTVR